MVCSTCIKTSSPSSFVGEPSSQTLILSAKLVGFFVAITAFVFTRHKIAVNERIILPQTTYELTYIQT